MSTSLKSVGILVLILCVIQSCHIAVSEDPLEVEGNAGDTNKGISATWSYGQVSHVKIATMEGPKSERYYTKCSISYISQMCSVCTEYRGSNIKGECKTSNKVSFFFDGLSVSNIGKHEVTFYFTTGSISHKYANIKITGINIDVPSSAHGKIGQSISFSASWNGITVTQVRLEKESGSQYSTTCDVSPLTHVCSSCNQAGGGDITTNCETTKKITFTFSSLMKTNAGSHVVEMTYGTGKVVKRVVTVVTFPVTALAVYNSAAPLFNAIILIAVFKLKEMLVY